MIMPVLMPVLIGPTISCAVIFLNELYQSFNVNKT